MSSTGARLAVSGHSYFGIPYSPELAVFSRLFIWFCRPGSVENTNAVVLPQRQTKTEIDDDIERRKHRWTKTEVDEYGGTLSSPLHSEPIYSAP